MALTQGTSDLFVIPDEAQRRSGAVVQGRTVYEPKDGSHLKVINKLLDPGLRRDDGLRINQMVP